MGGILALEEVRRLGEVSEAVGLLGAAGRFDSAAGPLWPLGQFSLVGVDRPLPLDDAAAILDRLVAGGGPRTVHYLMLPRREGGGGGGGGTGGGTGGGASRTAPPLRRSFALQLFLPMEGVGTPLDPLLTAWCHLAIGRNRSHPLQSLRRYRFSTDYAPVLEEALARINAGFARLRGFNVWAARDDLSRLLQLGVGDAVRDMAYIDRALRRVRPRRLTADQVIEIYREILAVTAALDDRRLERLSDRGLHRYHAMLVGWVVRRKIPLHSRVIDA